MLKLVKCEFAKLKRKKFILLVVFSAFLFPVPLTALMTMPQTVGEYDSKI
ncbi:MAG: ABC transporter permease, partial [Lachnospiraceae bacterium]|nr:ABC transporter permease [Lachnospiraceae bacterium]